MIIEQSKAQIADAVRFHARSEIGYLRLANARIWSRERLTKASADVSFDIRFKPGAVSLEPESVSLQTDFVFAMNAEKAEAADERQPLVIIECCFEAKYNLSEHYIPSETEIEAFRTANAVFNCWPFFREFVQTSATRMHYPPPPVPFLRLIRSRDQETHKLKKSE